MDREPITTNDQLRKRARRKYLSNSLAVGLVNLPKSRMTKQYAMTFACCDILGISERGEMVSNFYCKNRWCQTCAAVKMATMINKYLPVIEELNEKDDLYFVTLTLRTVGADKIDERIKYMQKCWRKIADQGRKYCNNFIGIRKTELKVGRGGGYHGHYHILVLGEQNAQFIIDQWLRLNPTEATRAAQDMRIVEGVERAALEVFKYATKCTCSEDGGNEIICTAEQMHVIFSALYGRRLFQPFGGLKAINEDEFEISADIVKKAAGLYKWVGHDWFHQDYGHSLTGWSPEQMEIAVRDWKKPKPKIGKQIRFRNDP